MESTAPFRFEASSSFLAFEIMRNVAGIEFRGSPWTSFVRDCQCFSFMIEAHPTDYFEVGHPFISQKSDKIHAC